MVAQSFNCAGCGGTLTLRAPGASLSVACSHCGTVVDAQDPRHQALSKHHLRVNISPEIPLGSRGELRGEKLEVIGYMRRKVRYYGVDYEWSEYLLYNPYKGFRWLLESNGHWTLLKPLPSPPKESR